MSWRLSTAEPRSASKPLRQRRGAPGQRPAFADPGRPAGNRGAREQGPRAQRPAQCRFRLPRAAHHPQPRPRRPTQGRRSLRPGHRTRHPRRQRPVARHRPRRPGVPRRTGPVRGDPASARRIAGRAGGARRKARSGGTEGKCRRGQPGQRADGVRRGPPAGDRRTPLGQARCRPTRPAACSARPSLIQTWPRSRARPPPSAPCWWPPPALHNLLLSGPPGTGKTLLASRLPGLLPALDEDEALEVAAIHSVASHVPLRHWPQRPFRQPHHSASAPALVGGGSRPQPGEITLAHQGVLFLDELPEFERKVLEVLREPLESGEIVIARANGRVRFPARFQLVAAMNPCPCGYLGDPSGRCRCARNRSSATGASCPDRCSIASTCTSACSAKAPACSQDTAKPLPPRSANGWAPHGNGNWPARAAPMPISISRRCTAIVHSPKRTAAGWRLPESAWNFPCAPCIAYSRWPGRWPTWSASMPSNAGTWRKPCSIGQ